MQDFVTGLFQPNFFRCLPIRSYLSCIFQVSSTIMRGPITDEVHQRINPWIYQVPCNFCWEDIRNLTFYFQSINCYGLCSILTLLCRDSGFLLMVIMLHQTCMQVTRLHKGKEHVEVEYIVSSPDYLIL